MQRKISGNQNLAYHISIGLKKKVQEDVLFVDEKQDLFVIADGHWGKEAAEIAVQFISQNPEFQTKENAIEFIKKIELELFQKFGKEEMDKDVDTPPETSILAARIISDTLHLLSYGDCYSYLVRSGEIISLNSQKPTWLGAFSYLGLRNRQSVEQSLEFKEIEIQKGDILLLMTDGITECVYETPTISEEDILKVIQEKTNSKQIVRELVEKAYECGGEDNIAVISYIQ